MSKEIASELMIEQAFFHKKAVLANRDCQSYLLVVRARQLLHCLCTSSCHAPALAKTDVGFQVVLTVSEDGTELTPR